MSEFLNCKQVADLLGVDVQYVRKLARENVVAAIKIGRSYRFTQASVDAYVASKAVRPC